MPPGPLAGAHRTASSTSADSPRRPEPRRGRFRPRFSLLLPALALLLGALSLFAAAPAAAQTTVTLTVTPTQVAEGVSVTVGVTLAPAAAQSVTIPITVTLGSAEAEDFGAGSLAGLRRGFTFNSGNSAKVFALTTAQDTDAEDETFTVALGTLPTGYSAGTTSSVTVTIQDDEPPHPRGPAPGKPVPTEVTAAAGPRTLSFRISCVTPGAARVTDYIVGYKKSDGSDSEVFLTHEFTLAEYNANRSCPTMVVELTGLAPGTEYTFRAKARNLRGRRGPWSDGVEAETPQMFLGGGSSDPDRKDALTASFEQVPAAHNGKDTFDLLVRLSETIGNFSKSPRASSFEVTQGSVVSVEQADAGLWRVRIRPSSSRSVVVTLAGGRDCDTEGAVCTRDIRALANTVTATVKGPPAEAPQVQQVDLSQQQGGEEDSQQQQRQAKKDPSLNLSGTNGPDDLDGSDAGDTLKGRQGDDVLRGLGGNDELRGGKDNDDLYGGRGADKLYGGEGDDRLYGGRGNDRLFGGNGDDTYTGGPGQDRFIFLSGETGDKIITDFEPGDLIVLRADGDPWPSVADIIAGVVAQDDRYFVYTLSNGLTVETDMALDAGDFQSGG